jgi:carboxypeptidase T
VVGDTTDWTYGEYAIPSFTIELRPDSPQAGGFILPPEQIQPTFEENLPAALEFIDHIL